MKLIEFKSANKYSFAYSFPRKKKKKQKLKEMCQECITNIKKKQKKEFTVHE